MNAIEPVSEAKLAANYRSFAYASSMAQSAGLRIAAFDDQADIDKFRLFAR